MADAAYYREWRAAHPEYRRREAARGRRRTRTPADRVSENARRRERRAQERAALVATFDHPFISTAREVVARFVKPDGRTRVYRPTFDDATSVAVLALVSGKDPEAAVSVFLKSERAWEFQAQPMLLS